MRILYGPHEDVCIVKGLYPKNIVMVTMNGKDYSVHSSQLFSLITTIHDVSRKVYCNACKDCQWNDGATILNEQSDTIVPEDSLMYEIVCIQGGCINLVYAEE